jgi:ELWxxDGT repeat protein
VPLTGFSEADQGFPDDFTVDGDRMFFSSGQVENTLWVTDGTRKGTREIPAAGSTPFNLVNGTLRMAGPTLFFSKTSDSSRLWRSDGTAAGTVEVPVNFAPGGFFRVLTAIPFGDRFLFLANAQNGGLKWWISDGTTAGTRILKDLALGPAPDFQRGQVPEHAIIDGIMYLTIETQAHGQELWRTDGSEDGTVMVADLMPGQDDSIPNGFQVFGNRLYFAATDPVHGRELWSSDGTAEGTHLVADVMPGDRSSGPAMLCVAGNRLFFAAEDPVAGYELHVLNLNRDAGMAATVAARSGVASPVEAGQMTEATPTDETLLRLAFNLDPAGSGRPVLEAGRGTSGYPSSTRAPGAFRVEYLRRRDGRWIYTPRCSTSLEPGSFTPMSGPESSVIINAEWERVMVEQAIAPGPPMMFGVVEVSEK